jgi:hypothetical protein
MLDRLGAHRNKEVIETLEAGGVHPFLIPPQASTLISPCDSSSFASMKARLLRMNTETTADKEAAFQTVYADYPREIIQHCFHHCGWEF